MTPADDHDFIDEVTFWFKASVLIVIRSVSNFIFQRPVRFPIDNQLTNEPVVSSSESDLWNPDDNDDNWILTAGKIQNLRIASKRLHGREVRANEIFSFWEHIGAPIKPRGYVVGREIREGCIVPAVAGGLCQLSNALYDAALKAGFEIIERHKHTKVVKGSLAEIDRDATVKWNYIDLRFRSTHAFRIEIELTSDQLITKFRSTLEKVHAKNIPVARSVAPSKLNDCYSCGNFDCFRHPDRSHHKKRASVVTFITDEKWVEHESYIKSVAGPNDRFISPSKAARIYRSVLFRLAAKLKRNVFSTSLKLDKLVAERMVEQIPFESTHLVISQNLLPFIWDAGALGGRTFDVLMTRLPMERLHQRLDDAHKKYPQSSTLNDFRADAELVESESIALTKARRIITPHQEIADIFVHKSIKVDWKFPAAIRPGTTGTKVLFPASILARKGAYEVQQLVKDLNLVITTSGPLEDVALVIYPAYVEHQPRALLRAIALGIPVITTTACGLQAGENVIIIPTGDYDALKQAVIDKLGLDVSWSAPARSLSASRLSSPTVSL